MIKAENDLSVTRRLVHPQEQIEISCKQGDCYVFLGRHSVAEFSAVLGTSANWLAASLSLAPNNVWSNGTWRLELVANVQTINTSSEALKRLG